MTGLICAALLVAFVLAWWAWTKVTGGHGRRRVLHRFTGHPDEARWEGDYTAGCTVGPRSCGAVWDGEDPR